MQYVDEMLLAHVESEMDQMKRIPTCPMSGQVRLLYIRPDGWYQSRLVGSGLPDFSGCHRLLVGSINQEVAIDG